MKNKKLKKILFCLVCILCIIIIWYFGVINTDLNKNTKNLESKLSQDISNNEYITKNLFDFDYDKIYVFQPYLSKSDMEEEIGFKFYKLKDSVSEGMVNILFVKDNAPVTYLYGYPSNIGYYIDLPIGEYTKLQLDRIQYKSVLKKVENSSKEENTYMIYIFDI